MEVIVLGFIDDFVDTVSRITDAPYLYLRSAAYFATSFLFGLNVYCPLAPPGASRPNIWIMLSGPAGITRKSTVIDRITMKFVKSVLSKYVMNKYQVSEKDANSVVSMMFFESATPEGLADHLQITRDMSGVDRYALMSTEFGGVFQLASRDYMSGFLQTLSKLYYGEGGTMLLSGRGKKKKEDRIRVIPSGLYVCALVGVQELHLYIEPILIKQGFLRRFIVVHQDAGDKEVRKPPLDPIRSFMASQLETLADKYVAMVENYEQFSPSLNSVKTVFVRFDKRVMDAINEYWDAAEREYIENPNDLWLLYKQSTWEHLLKLTVLECISRTFQPEDTSIDLQVKVKYEDFERAYEFLSKALEKSKLAIASVEASPNEQPLPISSGKVNFVFNLIDSAGKDGISRSDLLIKTGLLKDELKRIVITLMEQERVTAYRFKGLNGGRSQIRFFSTRYEKYASISGGQYIPSEQIEIIW